jgi:hypothetical protein
MHFGDVFMHHIVVKYELHGRTVVVSGEADREGWSSQRATPWIVRTECSLMKRKFE